MATNKLTDALCKRTLPTDKAQKLSDGHGMYLYVSTKGAKVWRMDYRIAGIGQTKVLGPYPLLTLAEARVARDEVRKQLLAGEDPSAKSAVKPSITLGAASASYWEGRKDVGPGYLEDATRGLALHLASLWNVPVNTLTKAQLMEPLMVLNAQEKFVYARRIRLWASQVLGWAVSHDHCTENVADQIDPKTAFGRRKVKHFASLKLRDVGGFVARLRLEVELQSVLAAWMLGYTWVRTKELRMMEWKDIEGDLWRLPEIVMKKGREHLVPLPRQAMEVLAKMKLRSRGSIYVFPNDRRLDRPMSENSVLYLLGRIGYGGLMTGHGFRSIASTWANEHDYDADAIEIALSHSADAKDDVRSAYNQAEKLPQRRQMLQDFADWLDKADAGLLQG
jgi:integrase